MTIVTSPIKVNSIPLNVLAHSPSSIRSYDDARFKNIGALIVKVTHRCNLDCLYCYEHITKGADMSLETFRNLADKALLNTTQKDVLFLFHGGEPSLIDESWYVEAVGYARWRAQRVNKEARFSMQSNILNITDKKIQLFKELGIRLSVSLDGPSTLPNALRQRADKAFETYQRLKEAGLKVGVLMTINHSNFNHFTEICQWLEEDAQVRDFKANVVASVGRGIDLPDLCAEQIFVAYRDILEYMIETNGAIIEDNLCLELTRFLAPPEEREQMSIELCRNKHCGAGERVVGITPEGQILPCGRFQWDEQEFFLGNLAQATNEQVLTDYEMAKQHFHSLVPESWYNCDTCEAKNVCSYGCQAFIVRSKKKANLDCIPTKMRYKYYLENKTRLLPLATLLKKRTLYKQSNYSDGYNDGPYSDSTYNDLYNDGKSNYNDQYSDKSYSDAYSDSKGYTDYVDVYNDGNKYNDYTDNKGYVDGG